MLKKNCRWEKKFLKTCNEVGVDGLIVVDLPPEENEELCIPSSKCGIDFIRLVTPTSDDERLDKLLKHSSGFLYYVSITGITGSNEAKNHSIHSFCLRPRILD